MYILIKETKRKTPIKGYTDTLHPENTIFFSFLEY